MTIVERVTDELNTLGIKAWYEYPGFVYIPNGQTIFASGDINETWTVDKQTEDGSEVLHTWDTGIDSASDAPGTIARAIAFIVETNR